jgi:LysM repeat protein
LVDQGGIIAGMTEPTPAGALACPFVAFEADRDARADVPDHRHRCYAEIRPAPRALAHQEAFCLSPGFAACPTFQDWARREAARPKPGTGADSNELAGLARPGRVAPADAAAAAGAAAAGSAAGDPAARPPRRDWAAPPAWVAGSSEPPDVEAPAFLTDPAGRSTGGAAAAGAAAGLAGSRWLNEVDAAPGDDPGLADLDRSIEADQAARKAREPAARPGPPADDVDDLDDSVLPVAVATASTGRRASQVSRRPPSSAEPGRPAWERSRRNEAYPTLKTRMGMPAIPRVVLALGALVIAAVVIFSLPFLFNLGGAPGPTTPPTSAGPSDSGLQSAGPSVSAGPVVATPQTYTVAAGDTMSKIAKKFGLTVAALEAANPQIKNPNNIKIGDKINIPSAAPSDVISGASPSPS